MATGEFSPHPNPLPRRMHSQALVPQRGGEGATLRLHAVSLNIGEAINAQQTHEAREFALAGFGLPLTQIFVDRRSLRLAYPESREGHVSVRQAVLVTRALDLARQLQSFESTR